MQKIIQSTALLGLPIQLQLMFDTTSNLKFSNVFIFTRLQRFSPTFLIIILCTLGIIIMTITIPESDAGPEFHSTIFGSSSSLLRNVLRRFTETLAWAKLEMSVGSVARGNRSTLKRERATKALSAVSRSFGLLRFTREYVANVTRATCDFECEVVNSFYRARGKKDFFSPRNGH